VGDLGKPFRVGAKLRNNRLIKAREDLGHLTARSAATVLDLNYSVLVSFETLYSRPWTRSGNWKGSALRVATAYGYSPDELWPEAVAHIAATKIEVEIDDPQPSSLADPDEGVARRELADVVRTVLAALTPKEKTVIELRFASDLTLREVGRHLKCTPGRIQQIESLALRKLRHPRLAKFLKPFVPESPEQPEPRPLNIPVQLLVSGEGEEVREVMEFEVRGMLVRRESIVDHDDNEVAIKYVLVKFLDGRG
jgi:RNA polymerase sigma factor (sigma-70 family)